ncbi:MAG: M50 family metallopeptidase [Chloroflexota bacterium]
MISATVVLNWLLSAAAIALVFGGMMTAHEYGHYLFAKRAKMRVDEFSIGIGPKLYSFKRGETLFSIRPVPVMAFVKIAGSTPDEIDDPDGFARKPLLSRIMTIAGGPLANIVLAVVLFALVFMGQGYPVTPKIESVTEGKPAAMAGLLPGDLVIAIDGRRTTDWEQLRVAIVAHPNQPLRLTVNRAGATQDIVVVPQTTVESQGQPVIGVTIGAEFRRLNVISAIGQAARETGRQVAGWAQGLGMLITRRIPGGVDASLQGPVGISRYIGRAASVGLFALLAVAAQLSTILGLMNLLPIPALDGSRLVFLGIEGIRRRPIDPERENMVHVVGLALLLALAVFVTYLDIKKLGTPLP